MFLLQAQAFKRCKLKSVEQPKEDAIFRNMFGGNLAQMSFSYLNDFDQISVDVHKVFGAIFCNEAVPVST